MSPTLLEEAPAAAPTRAPSTPVPALGSRWIAALVLLGSIAAAVGVYASFCQHSRALWWWMGHDRHSHYMYGLNLAMDVRGGDLVRLFHDFDRMRVWGPVHPVLVALVECVGGPDQRLAVLPSLAGWIMAIWFAFLTARRMLPSGGNAAGLLAAFFVAVSPAHRAYATDCMYESLGAGLSLAALYFYLATVQDQSRRAAVALGVTLSILFLHKYNYWLLVLFGLGAAEFTRRPQAWFAFARSLCSSDRLPAWALAEIRHPLNWIALALAGVAVAVVITGGGAIGGVSVQEPHNLVHLAYVAFFLRLCLWWRAAGRDWSLTLPPTVRAVLIWHGGAIALWFLMPKRLSYFLWYLGPNNDDQKRESVPLLHGLPYYLQGLADDYLTLPWSVALLGVALLFGLIAWRKLNAGSAAVFAFLAIGALLTCQHPMLKNRFLHSWIAAAWVIGAVGLVFAVQELIGLIAAPARGYASVIVCAVVIGLHAPALVEPGRAQEGGLKAELPSPLRITDTYLPALADARNPTIVSNVSTRFLWTWTFIEHHRHQNMAAEIKNFAAFDGNPEAARHWLESTRSDALVLIDIRPNTTYDWKTKEYVDLAAFHQALAAQSAWALRQRWEMPEGVSITLWAKTETARAGR